MQTFLHPIDPFDKLIVAVDVPAAVQAQNLADSLLGICKWMKIGLELYTAAGPEIVQIIQKKGFSIFLDLKLLEIPNSVRGAIAAAASMGVSMVTIHASGGPKMIDAALESAMAEGRRMKVLAITVPTGMDRQELQAVGIEADPVEQVLRLAKLAAACGVPGIVCSPRESAIVRNNVPESTLLVIPGIRPTAYGADDQVRIATPTEAIASGADYLVIGRPITKHSDPAEAARAIQKEIAEASSRKSR
jgi:orotidine-5'-phosphate decarboxylase